MNNPAVFDLDGIQIANEVLNKLRSLQIQTPPSAEAEAKLKAALVAVLFERGFTFRNVLADALACIAPSPEPIARTRTAVRHDRLERVRRAIDQYLTSPSLRAAFLCKTVGISRSGLYRLFQDSGGVARYIQRQRLLRAHAILSDPANRRSILSVAEEFCFADASGFSRAFRKEFAYRPSDAALAAPDRMHAAKMRAPGRERFGGGKLAVWGRAHRPCGAESMADAHNPV